eukprot:TRINITY_DN1605_c1_g1_i2.p1 TRINITY_DN1605_c1_g1~~TRINITY_DN1605_c1_g1_i2.p1  ORF type:complete len:500 (-),score=153.05 TRINITY_DN1605_c1_g1_i2:694-2193(-)
MCGRSGMCGRPGMCGRSRRRRRGIGRMRRKSTSTSPCESLMKGEKASSKRTGDEKGDKHGEKKGFWKVKEKKNEKEIVEDVITGPFGVVHQTGLSSDMEWYGKDPFQLFRLSSKLGEGSFGVVWKIEPKACPPNSGVAFAAKHITINPDTDTREVENEIDILKGCKSLHIVSYYGVFRQESLLWIIMDYCELGSVLDMMELTDCVLGEPSAAWLLRSTLLGLSYLHSKGVVHRDVKAGNILVNSNGDAKVADFGVSEQLANTLDGEIAGSPLWMAPEVIQAKNYDHRCDIWSLGITAIEFVDGEPPHADLSPWKAMNTITRSPPPTVDDPNTASDEFLDFLTKVLVKDQEGRWEIAQLLEHPFLVNADVAPFKGVVDEVLKLKTASQTSRAEDKYTLIPIVPQEPKEEEEEVKKKPSNEKKVSSKSPKKKKKEEEKKVPKSPSSRDKKKKNSKEKAKKEGERSPRQRKEGEKSNGQTSEEGKGVKSEEGKSVKSEEGKE